MYEHISTSGGSDWEAPDPVGQHPAEMINGKDPLSWALRHEDRIWFAAQITICLLYIKWVVV